MNCKLVLESQKSRSAFGSGPSVLSNQKGFTLTEVLVAVGISTVVLYMVVSMITTGTWSDIRLNVRQESRDAAEELKQMAKSPACGISQLLGSTGVSGQSTQIDLVPADNFFTRLGTESTDPTNVSRWFNEISLNGTSNDGLSSNGLSFVRTVSYGKLQVSDVRIMPLKTPTANAPEFTYSLIAPHKVRAQLYVAFQPQAGAAEGQLQTIRYPIILHLNDDNTAIINCTSVEELATSIQMCDSFGGEWMSDIQQCDIRANSTTTGSPNNCQVDEPCNVLPQYRL